MNPTGFVARVTVESAIALGVLAIASGWLAGTAGSLGVLIGGGLAIGNLWWLGRRAMLAATGAQAGWAIAALLRLGVAALVVGIVLASGFAHPIAVVVGLTVLPCAIVARGLAGAREA